MSEDFPRVVGFRLARQHVTEPLEESQLGEAASLGVQDTAPGSAALSLALRCKEFDLAAMSAAVAAGNLVPAWGPRLASHLVPPAELTMLTYALLAEDERSLATQVPALAGMSGRGQISLLKLVDQVSEFIQGIVAKESLTKEEVGERMNPQLPEGASIWCDRCKRSHPPEPLVRLMMWSGRVRLEPDESTRDEVIAPHSLWMARDRPTAKELREARASLVRGFLRRFGPANAELLAGWAGIGKRYADTLWKSVDGELAGVRVAGGQRSLLAEDAEAFKDAQPAEGIVMLPAYDPFLQARDRELLAEDVARQKQIWRFNANPGVILENGTLLGLWRARRSGKRLAVEVNPYRKVTRAAQQAMERAAEGMAATLGKAEAPLTIGPEPR